MRRTASMLGNASMIFLSISNTANVTLGTMVPIALLKARNNIS